MLQIMIHSEMIIPITDIDEIFPANTEIQGLFVYILKFSPLFSDANYSQKKLFSDVFKRILLKNIHVYSLNLLKFVFIMFNVETVAENAKLAILKLLELQIFLVSSTHDLGQMRTFYLRRVLSISQKVKCRL